MALRRTHFNSSQAGAPGKIIEAERVLYLVSILEILRFLTDPFWSFSL